MEPSEIIKQFHKLYYDSNVWGDTHWLGIQTLKCPMDMWSYQEILFDLRPELIIETGTYAGGSAFYFATICDWIKEGRILSIDIENRPGRPTHPRIEYWTGSSISEETLGRVKAAAQGKKTVLVVLDSDHHKDHVLAEMKAYSSIVTPGSYLIVEDTNVGNPVFPEFGPGPMEAVREFLVDSKDFEVDARRQKFLMTFNPSGYLRKKL